MDNTTASIHPDLRAAVPTAETEKAKAALEAKLAQIEQAFTYHPPKAEQPHHYEQLRSQFKALATALVRLTPGSREQSLALTHLEQAVMWANAAIARHE